MVEQWSMKHVLCVMQSIITSFSMMITMVHASEPVTHNYQEIAARAQRLLVENPRQAYAERETLFQEWQLGGHNWQALGWTKTPKAMIRFVHTIVSLTRTIAEKNPHCPLRLLSIAPDGRFTDLVLIAHLQAFHPTFHYALTRYSGWCNDDEVIQESNALVRWVGLMDPTKRTVTIEPPVREYCVYHEECLQTRTQKNATYDLLFACTGVEFDEPGTEMIDQREAAMDDLMKDKHAFAGVLLTLQKGRPVLVTKKSDSWYARSRPKKLVVHHTGNTEK